MRAFSVAGLAVFLIFLMAGAEGFAARLQDFKPYEYDVRFTNPICQEYKYAERVVSRSGEELTAKPKNAFCRTADAERSAAQKEAPLQKLLEWIRDRETKEVFFTYLSFSNDIVSEALCEAIEKRDVKVTFVLDEETDDKQAQELLKCRASKASLQPKFHTRGHVSGMGYAHNKIFIVNPHDPKKIKISFGSGNMTSGIVLHHENWHFITTSPESYFAQAHICVMDAELDHAASAKDFRAYMNSCLEEIEGDPETDIQAYFVPGGGDAATEAITSALDWATRVDIAAHRFSYTEMIEALKEKMAAKFTLRLVFDDDMLWVREGAKGRPNLPQEARKVKELVELGADVRYIETNHNQKLLHHNKFIVFHGRGDRKATFVGAGNFTGAAFSENLENFYFVTIPEVVDKMAEQYDHLFKDLGTAEEDMPKKDVMPK